MNKLLHQLEDRAIRQDGNRRFIFVQLADGQIKQVDLKRYTLEEFDKEMGGYNHNAEGITLHGFMGNATNAEKLELGSLLYFEGETVTVINSYEEMMAAKPAFDKYKEELSKELL